MTDQNMKQSVNIFRILQQFNPTKSKTSDIDDTGYIALRQILKWNSLPSCIGVMHARDAGTQRQCFTCAFEHARGIILCSLSSRGLPAR
ncbi:MAG: hypothetical protein QXL71_09080 [Candidatus Bathyarchaeia archaeon]